MPSAIAQLLLLFFFAVAVQCAPNRLAERAVLIDDVQRLRPRYDYIIAGGGTAGLTVADRLTEDPRSVVVPGVQVPEKYSRNYQSVPQPGLNNRQSPAYTAAVVGGASVVNGMFFNRGSAGDYDAWEQLGNPGWGWRDLLPYFKKSEAFTPPSAEIAERFPISSDLGPHGTNGPVGSSFPRYQYPGVELFFKAWNSIGVASNPQPNAGQAKGVIYSTSSLYYESQTRSTASTAHYRPYIGKRSNYHLITGQSVSRIIFNRRLRATGVEFISTSDKTKHKVRAAREVVIAAGTVRSPQILQLSGVGPKKLLSGLGIKTLVDLPGVGYNFQDQPSMYPTVNYNRDFPSNDWHYTHPDWIAEQLEIYYKNRTGAMTLTFNSGNTAAFLPLRQATPNAAQLIRAAASVDLSKLLPPGADSDLLTGYRAQRDILLDLYGSDRTTVMEVAFGGTRTIPIAIMKPLSRGSILINSVDPLAAPVIDYRTFSHPADLDVAVVALKKTREFINSEPLKQLGTVEATPGAKIQSDQAIANAIRGLATSTWQHPVGTLSMMKREYGGVLDPELRVYGLLNVRVVDASMMPLIPAAHTSSTVYAVAEKAADLIKRRKRDFDGFANSENDEDYR